MIRRMIAPLAFAAVVLFAGQAYAQGTFPAPLPGQAEAPSNAGPAFERAPAPPSGGALGTCMNEFAQLLEEAEQRRKLIMAARDRRAPPHEACKLIGNFGQAEIKMIKFVESNVARCGIPPRVADQMKADHKNTESMQKKACAVAQGRTPAGPVGDFAPLPASVN